MRTTSSTNSFKKFSGPKWLWRIGLVCLILFGAATLFKIFYLENWLQQKVVKLVAEKSDGFYKLHIGNLEVSAWGRSITVDDLRLVPDYELWHRRQKNRPVDLPTALVQLNVRQLRISGINYFNLLRNRPVNLHAIVLQKPVVTYTHLAPDTTTGRPLHQQLPGPLQHFKVDNIRLNGATFISRVYGEKSNKLKLTGVDLQIGGLQLDSASFHDPQRVFFTRQVYMQAHATDIMLPGAFYRIRTGKMTLASAKGEIGLDSIRLVPLYQPKEMARRKGRAVTWLDIFIPAARLSGVNFPVLSQSSDVAIGKVVFESPRINAFSDKKNFKSRGYKPLMHDLVQEVNTGLMLKEVLVKNMYVRYEELSSKAAKPGYITLEKTALTLQNITNDKNRISKENPAVIKVHGMVMGKARLHLNIRANLLDKNGDHTVQGWIGKGDPRILNPILEPTVLLRVKSGLIQKGTFRMQLSRNSGTGTMQLHYQDFKVDLLSKTSESKAEPAESDEAKNQSFPKKVLSALANKVLIKSENKPDKGKAAEPAAENGLREGKIKITRRKERSIFTYWIDGMASGMLSSIGMGSKLPKN